MMYAVKQKPAIKTACELGLHIKYWRGLWEVLYRLERGWFTPARGYDTGPNCFDIRQYWYEDQCGSIGCMSGWAIHFAGGKVRLTTLAHSTVEQQERHEDLMCPPRYAWRANLYPPERCAVALRAYLETGKAKW